MPPGERSAVASAPGGPVSESEYGTLCHAAPRTGRPRRVLVLAIFGSIVLVSVHLELGRGGVRSAPHAR